jgi:hypothetical protein
MYIVKKIMLYTWSKLRHKSFMQFCFMHNNYSWMWRFGGCYETAHPKLSKYIKRTLNVLQVDVLYNIFKILTSLSAIFKTVIQTMCHNLIHEKIHLFCMILNYFEQLYWKLNHCHNWLTNISFQKFKIKFK